MNRLTYRFLRFNYYLRQWTFTQFTPLGIGLLCALFICGLIGLDIRRSVSYQLFTFLLALLLVSTALLPFSRHRLSVSRSLPRFGTVGVPLSYRIRIHNPNRKRISGLKLFERFSHSFPTFQEFKRVFKGKREFQRRAWFLLLARKQWAFSPAQTLPTVVARGETEATGEIVPLRRGVLRFQNLVIACPEPLGFMNRRLKLCVPQSVLVLPKRYQLPDIALPGAKHERTNGLAITLSKGQSEEFHSLREYRPGDARRKIHWKSWAKTGVPIIREEQDNSTVRHALILDTFQKEAYSEVLEESIAIAASFAYTLQNQPSLLSLVITGTQVYRFSSDRSLRQTEQLLEFLATAQPSQQEPFESLLAAVRSELTAMGGCICILLDWDDDRQSLLEQLQMSGIPTLALVIETTEGLSKSIDRSCLSDRQSRIEVLNIHNIQEALLKL